MNLICDTSFVGHFLRREERPVGYESWGVDVLGWIEESPWAVSIVTVAEARYGYLSSGWGNTRLAEAEARLRRFRWIPVRHRYVGEWARLRAASPRRGIAIGDNDLWIAATASVGERVLVTCDRDHQRIAPELPVEVVFLAPPV